MTGSAASGTVVFINSGSKLLTTYASSTSGGATETLSLASSTSASQYGYNNLNELTSIAAGGATRFEGTANKALKSATVNSNAATLPDSQKFAGNATLSSGVNTVPASVTDGTNTTKTSSFRVSAKGSASSSPTFDANGNMTNDGTNTYEWDAEDRLVKINYPGTGNYSQMTYDGNWHCARIVEVVGGSTTSTRQFIWDDNEVKELRDGSGAVLSLYFGYGQTISGGSYYITRDSLASIRELANNTVNIQAQYAFDPYGQVTKIQGSLTSDFQFAGYYMHAPSFLNLTEYRAYNSRNGRWLSRDPIGDQDVNPYTYSFNNPIHFKDPSGLLPGYDPNVQGIIDLTGAEPVCVPNNSERPRRQMPSKIGFECCEAYDDACCTDNWVDCRIRCDDRYRYGTVAHRFCVDCCKDQNISCHQRVRGGGKFGGGNWGRCVRHRKHVRR